MRAVARAWDLAGANAPHGIPGDWRMGAGELARTPFRYLTFAGASLSTGTGTGAGTGSDSDIGTDIGTGSGTGTGTGEVTGVVL